MRLHRRHLTSTPPGTRRASRLPQWQRSASSSRSGRCGRLDARESRLAHLRHRLFSFVRHPKRGRDEGAEQQRLHRQGLHRRINSQQRHRRWKFQRRRRHPAGRLQLVDSGAGEDKSHDVKQSAGDAEKIFERHAQAELENREGRRQQRNDTGEKAADDRLVATLRSAAIAPDRTALLRRLPDTRRRRRCRRGQGCVCSKDVLDSVLNERLPAPGFAARVQPVADVEERRRGENRDEALHAFAMLAAESEHRLGGEPGDHPGAKREDPAEMDVADRRASRP